MINHAARSPALQTLTPQGKSVIGRAPYFSVSRALLLGGLVLFTACAVTLSWAGQSTQDTSIDNGAESALPADAAVVAVPRQSTALKGVVAKIRELREKSQTS